MREPDLSPPPRSIARRIDREMFLLLGGTAALLLQVAHPLVAAGVAQHSRFREEPFGRLHRTLDTTLTVVFSEPDAARRALRRIDRRHLTVAGVTEDAEVAERERYWAETKRIAYTPIDALTAGLLPPALAMRSACAGAHGNA